MTYVKHLYNHFNLYNLYTYIKKLVVLLILLTPVFKGNMTVSS